MMALLELKIKLKKKKKQFIHIITETRKIPRDGAIQQCQQTSWQSVRIFSYEYNNIMLMNKYL